jgi:hypothetical protein
MLIDIHFVRRCFGPRIMPLWGRRTEACVVARPGGSNVKPSAVATPLPKRRASTSGLAKRRRSLPADKAPPKAKRRKLGKDMAGSLVAASRSSVTPERRLKSPSVLEDFAEKLGPVTESRADHLSRHGGGMSNCPRCRFYTFGQRWFVAYGQVVDPRRPVVNNREQMVQWATERPVHLGGTWAIGCVFCAGHSVRQRLPVAARENSRHKPRIGTKWARFEVRPQNLQCEHVREHMHFECHKDASKTHFLPEEARVVMRSMPDDDLELLRGGVPQADDWLTAWSAARSPQSWAQMARFERTQHYIHEGRSRSLHPKVFPRMTRIMIEALRERKRRWLAAARAIHLSFDEKSPLLHLRFKCDVPSEEWGKALAWQVPRAIASPADARRKMCTEALRCTYQTGILVTVHVYRGMSRGDFDEDYGVRMAATITKATEVFCTPFRGVRDETVYRALLLKVRALSVDGALLKVAQALKLSSMPSIVIVFRDGAHMIRTALRDPLHRTGEFQQQQARLFGDKGALFKVIQYSDKLKSMLEACQRRVLQTSGAQGGGLTTVCRDYSFSAIRWESESEPRRRYACTLVAVALMLSDIVTDTRLEASKRRRAKEALEAMTSRELLRTGVVGDYSEVCMEFIRWFDENDGDPSAEVPEMRAFQEKLRSLFVDSYILCRSAGTSGETAKTLTAIVVDQLESLTHLRFIDQSLPMWNGISFDDVAAVMAEMKSIVEDGTARLDVDFSADELRTALYAFHLGHWLQANRESTAQGTATAGLLRLRSLARRLCEGIGLEYVSMDFKLAVQSAAHELRKLQQMLGDEVDNRLAWAKAVAEAHGKTTDEAKAIANIRPAIDLFLAVNKGTGRVERDLGRLTKFLEGHKGGAEGDDSWPALCAELQADGPQREEEVFAKCPETHTLCFTPFSRECAKLWVAFHGRRFGAQCKPRKDTGIKTTGRNYVGSLKSVRDGQRDAAKKLHLSAALAAAPKFTVSGHDRATIVGATLSTSILEPTQSLCNFRKRTGEIKRLKAATSKAWPGFNPGALKLKRRVIGARLPPPPRQIGSKIAAPAPARSKFSTAFMASRRKLLSKSISWQVMKDLTEPNHNFNDLLNWLQGVARGDYMFSSFPGARFM